MVKAPVSSVPASASAASCGVPRWPTIAVSTRMYSGSAARAPSAGRASLRISRSCGERRSTARHSKTVESELPCPRRRVIRGCGNKDSTSKRSLTVKWEAFGSERGNVNRELPQTYREVRMAYRTRVLVVANRTADSEGLAHALSNRPDAANATFTLLVPVSRRGPDRAKGLETARSQLESGLGRLRDAGLEVKGLLGDPD